MILIVAVTITGCGNGGPAASGLRAGGGATLDSVMFAHAPLFKNRANNAIARLYLSCDSTSVPVFIREISIRFTPGTALSSLEAVTATLSGEGEGSDVVVSVRPRPLSRIKFRGGGRLTPGTGVVTLAISLSEAARLTDRAGIASIQVTLSDGSRLTHDIAAPEILRPGIVVRAAGQDGCDTYRIPGMVTTSAGTLIAVYDVRYNNSKDLQEDIDIGMSRSTDGGESWEPMRVIMDMGEYGGLPQNRNGVGDPAVLYDHFTNTIWVAALWLNGSAPDRALWWDSRPGITPQETGQIMLVKSSDDGLTWSDPVSITGQVKDPAWQLLLQGPGRGITMSDGTLVFAAQYKADLGVKAIDGGDYTCHSTIIWSRDRGETWHIGAGAKPNTTEAQVVELPDGSLMLNMRDDLNRMDKGETNGRAVAVTRDMGLTWSMHPSSGGALPEPNCMASLIAATMTTDGMSRNLLFFSNPDDRYDRVKMTIKMSTDLGMTWPDTQKIELCRPGGFGYSCLTMVDENHVGILYEGVKELYFQKVPVAEFFRPGTQE